MYTLGIDPGSSSVKMALLDVGSGRCAGGAMSPDAEMAISAPQPGVAEQDPVSWYDNARRAVRRTLEQAGAAAEHVRNDWTAATTISLGDDDSHERDRRDVGRVSVVRP